MHVTADIETAHARRYLGQLVKHFSHKLPFALAEDNDRGELNFPLGLCQLSANDSRLHIDLNAQTEDDMLKLQDVVIRHLVRFAFREELKAAWRNAA